MSIIRVEHLEKTFGSVTPIKDISFEVNKGDVISIIGPSGTGKTTLIRCLNMLDSPSSGKIYYHDECINEGNCDYSKLRTKVGMVFQSFNLFGHKTVIENISMAPMDILGVSKEAAYARAEKWLKAVGLFSKKDNYPDELSGGQRQRVAIARCVAMDPEVILFDEPTSALDPTTVYEVQGQIKKLADLGKTMLIVTHEMEFAKSVANRVFYLDQGVVYEQGTPEEVFDNPQKERTKAFMKKLKTFSYSVNVNEIEYVNLSSELSEYGKKSGISNRILYKLNLLLEETIQGFVATGAENIRDFNIFIEYDSENQNARVNLYFNGENKPHQVDEYTVKIVKAYSKNFTVDKNVDGYDTRLSFEVDAEYSNA